MLNEKFAFETLLHSRAVLSIVTKANLINQHLEERKKNFRVCLCVPLPFVLLLLLHTEAVNIKSLVKALLLAGLVRWGELTTFL